MQVSVIREDVTFKPDPSRVIARFFYTNDERSLEIVKKVLDMSEEEANTALEQVLRSYSLRHRNISKIFEKHFTNIKFLFDELKVNPKKINHPRKVLIGSYFTMEYSIESAAFFNPSIIEHPDQTEIMPGKKRVILSFRGTGERHISSIVFRLGVIDSNNKLYIEPVGKMLDEAEHIKRHIYSKKSFSKKLEELQIFDSIVPPDMILDRLKNRFTYGDLKACIADAKKSLHLAKQKEALFNKIIWLASTHYELDFSLDTALSERVIFPVSETERNGVEDARFVKFTDTNGEVTYYATYTAFDGTCILPKLLQTKNFYHFKIAPMHGDIAQNKGMALFPRKINGKYAMLCRLDGINNFIAYSDKVNIWRKAKLLQKPKYHWEYIQIGNCGSPIETEEGWLVITHAVGQMREYVLGASLFDLDNPEKEIGRLKHPLMVPNEEEREGYVPNVIYSCGVIEHNGEIIIPYAMSDYASTYARVNLKELLAEIKGNS